MHVRAEEIADALEHVRAEPSAPLVVVGRHGDGLTTVLQSITEGAGLPATVLTASRAEAGWPLSGLSAVLAAIDTVQGSDLAADPDLMGEELDDFTRARTLHRRVVDVASQEMLLVLDDADDFDHTSRRLLGYLLRRMNGSRLRVVVGLHRISESRDFEGIAEVKLAPVPVAELVELGLERRDRCSDPSVLEFVARLSGGSPLAFLSFLDGLSADVLRGAAPLPVPLDPGPRLTEAVTATLADLSPAAEQVARALGASFFLPASVLHAVPELTIAGLQELKARRILTRTGDVYEVTDPASALVVYWRTPTGERVRLHETLRSASEGIDAGLEAWHASHLEPSLDQAAPMLAAGLARIRRGELLLGMRLVERSLSLGDLAHPASALEEIGEELLLSSQISHARRYLGMLLASGDGVGPSTRTVSLRLLLDGLGEQRVDRMVLRDAFSAFSSSDPTGCAELLLVALSIRLYRFEIDPAQRLLAQAAELLGPDHVRVQRARARVELIRSALEGEELPAPFTLLSSAKGLAGRLERILDRVFTARALSVVDRYEDAVSVLGQILDAGPTVPRLAVDLALDTLFTVEMRAGRPARARQAAERAGTSSSPHGAFPMNQLVRLAELALLDDDLDGAQRLLVALLHRVEAGTSTAVRCRMLVQEGRLAVAQGDPETAVRYLRQSAELGRRHSNPDLHRFHDLLIEALLALGRHDEAREVLEEFTRLAGLHPSRWAERALARVRAVMEGGPAGLAAIEDLLATWPPGQDEMLRFRTQQAYGQMLTAQGRAHRGIEIRREAVEPVIGIGARRSDLAQDPAGEQAGSLRREQTTGTMRKADLDERERPVVELVLRGWKNRAIARELHVSVRTVEMRLTGLYRRYAVSSRGELVALLRDDDLVESP